MPDSPRYSRLEHQPTQLEQLRREFEIRLSEQDRRLLDNIKALDRQTEMANVNSRHAVELARESLEKRLDGMNEFRDQLRDQTQQFATRENVDAVRGLHDSEVAANRERITRVENEMANWRGRGTMAIALLGGFFTIVQIALHFIGR